MADHTWRMTVDADKAQAAQQMHVAAQGRAQLLLHAQAVLQQYDLGAGCGGLHDQRCQLIIAGGLGTDQQPVARRHVGGTGIGLYLHLQRTMHVTVQGQPLLTDGLVLAAQQKMHIETGPGQHQPIETADGATADDTDARGVRMHADLRV